MIHTSSETRWVEQARLDRVSHRRMGDRQQLDPAALADDKDRRIAHVVGPDGRIYKLDGGQRRGRPHSE